MLPRVSRARMEHGQDYRKGGGERPGQRRGGDWPAGKVKSSVPDALKLKRKSTDDGRASIKFKLKSKYEVPSEFKLTQADPQTQWRAPCSGSGTAGEFLRLFQQNHEDCARSESGTVSWPVKNVEAQDPAATTNAIRQGEPDCVRFRATSLY